MKEVSRPWLIKRTGNDGFGEHKSATNHMTKLGRQQVYQPIIPWIKENFLDFCGG